MKYPKALTVIVLAIVWCALVARANAAKVMVNGALEHQTIKGGGIAFGEDDTYPIPLGDVAAQAYALGFRVARQFSGRYLEVNNDDGDPFHYNLDNGPSSFNAQFAAADAYFRRARTMQDAGFEVWPAFQGAPAWMCTSDDKFDSTIPCIYDEVAEYWAAFLLYAHNNYGIIYSSLSLACEPDCRPGTLWTAMQFRDAIEAVGARLESESLTTGITTPHCARIDISQNWLQTILADATAASYLNAIAYHSYYNWPSVDAMGTAMRDFANDALINDSGLPIWQTEWVLQKCAGYPKRSEAYIETLGYALDTAKFVHYCYAEGQCSLVTLSPGVAMEYAKDNGMFGPGVGPGGLRLKKFAHAITQYHRFIEPGSKRIDAAISGASNIFVTAYKHLTSGALTIVTINESTSPASVTVNLSNLSPPASMRGVRTSAVEDSAELGRVPVSGNSFTVALPGESITTYVGSTVSDTSPPSVPAGVGAEALSDTMVRVTWNASTDDVRVAEYKVCRNEFELKITAGMSYIDQGLEAETNYSYTVQALDLAGNESPKSSPVDVTTFFDTFPPAIPSHVEATPQPGAITLTWDPTTDIVTDHDLSGFRVYVASGAQGQYGLLADLNDPGATGYTHMPVANGQEYRYVVTAYDDEEPANESAYSGVATAAAYPRVPGGLQADYYDSEYVSKGQASAWDWFHDLKVSRTDAAVDFNWETATPPAGRYIKGMYGTTDHWCLFGVRWQGEILADHTDSYTFETRNLDGARLWVDWQLVIDDWTGWYTRTNTASIPLTAGWHAIRLDYYRYHPEADEDGVIQLYYSSPAVARRIIPSDHLATVGDKMVNVNLTPSADSWIQDEGGNSRDGNLGTLNIMAVGGRWHTTYFRGFIRFDLSSIPCNATIDNATLRSYHTVNAIEGSNVNDIRIYEVLRDWKEREITWNDYAAGKPWTIPGAAAIGKDRDDTILATGSFSSSTPVNQYYDFDVTNAIQGCVSGVKRNYGFILMGKEVPAANRYFTGFSTKESAANPPLLSVTYIRPLAILPPIQVAIDDANDGDTLIIQPGRYCENINFKGKKLNLRATDPNNLAVVAATIIDGHGQSPVVTFSSGEDADCVLAGFTLSGGSTGIYCSDASPTITKCVITNNYGPGIMVHNACNPTVANCTVTANKGAGIELWTGPRHASLVTITNCTIVANEQGGILSGIPTITNSIIRANSPQQVMSPYSAVTYSNIQGGWPGTGNIDGDPCFVGSKVGDFHLKWNSPCINSGDPDYTADGSATDIDGEPRIIAGRVDMGADEVGPKQGDFTRDGLINFKDLALFAESWLCQPGDDNWNVLHDLFGDGCVESADLSVLADDWLWQATWYRP